MPVDDVDQLLGVVGGVIDRLGIEGADVGRVASVAAPWTIADPVSMQPVPPQGALGQPNGTTSILAISVRLFAELSE